MIDWKRGTWESGDVVKFHQGHEQEPRFQKVSPGLYWYSGWGSGTFFRPDGTMKMNCPPSEARAEAERLGVEMRYVDSFDVESFKSVMG